MSFFHAPIHDTNKSPIVLKNPVMIADLHLGVSTPGLVTMFLDFMQALHTHPLLKTRQELVILGDLFDAWLGDDTRDSLAPVMAALREFSAHRALYIMQGNRDFLMGGELARAVGAELIADPVRAHIGTGASSLVALLSHGDRWCTADERYQTVRARLRNPWIQRGLLALPRFVRVAVAKNARAKSQRAKAQVVRQEILDVTPSAVCDEARAEQVDLVIHGHTHRPGMHALAASPIQFTLGKPLSRGTRIVLADWLERDGTPTKGDALVFEAGSPKRLELTTLLAA